MKIQFLFEVKFSSFTLVTQYFRILFYSVIFQILLQTLKLKFFYTECFCSSNLKIELYKDLKILNYWKTLMKKKTLFMLFHYLLIFSFVLKIHFGIFIWNLNLTYAFIFQQILHFTMPLEFSPLIIFFPFILLIYSLSVFK